MSFLIQETPMRSLFLPFLGLLTLVAGMCAAEPAVQDRPQRAAVKAILQLADNLDVGDVAKRAQALVAAHDSCEISSVFRPRKYGGAGIGSAAATPAVNSIDHLVQRWSGTSPPTREELEKHQADLARTARVLRAMAELAPFRTPGFKKGDPRIEEWQQVARDFKAVTRELH